MGAAAVEWLLQESFFSLLWGLTDMFRDYRCVGVDKTGLLKSGCPLQRTLSLDACYGPGHSLLFFCSTLTVLLFLNEIAELHGLAETSFRGRKSRVIIRFKKTNSYMLNQLATSIRQDREPIRGKELQSGRVRPADFQQRSAFKFSQL